MTATASAAAGSSTAAFLSSLQTVPVVHPAHLETNDISLATEILPAPPPLPLPAPSAKRELKRPAPPPPSYLPASDPGSTFSSAYATVTYAGPEDSSTRRPKRARLLTRPAPERANDRPQRSTRPPQRIAQDGGKRSSPRAQPDPAQRGTSPASPSADDERERSMSIPFVAAPDDDGNAADSDPNHMSNLTNGVAQTAQEPSKDPPVDELLLHNNDHCSACRSQGALLYCDGCPRAFHLWCLDPPIEPDDPPREAKWLCPSCEPPTFKRRRKVDNHPAFSPLFQTLRQRVPAEFQLPADIRGHFRDVATGPRGGYLGGGKVPRPHRHGLIEDRDPYKLREKDSAAVLCFRCNKSAFSGSSQGAKGTVSKRARLSVDGADSRRWRSIVSCDYCDLHWHLDCLDPPLTVMPPRAHKWMCPNHVDKVLPTRRIPKHMHKTLDVDRPGMMNNGNIDIVPSEDPPILGPPVDEVFIGGQKYRVPERVVILDFWDRCKRTTPVVTPESQRMAKLRNDAIEALASLRSGHSQATSQASSQHSAQANGQTALHTATLTDDSMDALDAVGTDSNPSSPSTGSTLSSLTPTPSPEPPRISFKIRIPPLSSLMTSPKRPQRPRRSLRSVTAPQQNGGD